MLGIPESEFWSLTPEHVWKLREYWEHNEKAKDFRFGVLCALIANLQADREGHPDPYKPEDFFASLKAEEKPKEPMSGQAMENALKAIALQFGGETEAQKKAREKRVLTRS